MTASPTWESGEYPVLDVAPGTSCLTYDEEMEQTVQWNKDNNPDFDADRGMHEPNFEQLGGLGVFKDADPFTRQDDKGPYHWAQGPADLAPVITPPPPPPPTGPSPQPTTPGQIPRRGHAITTTNLRLRKSAGANQPSLGVLHTGTEVLMTGGRRRIEGALWVRVIVDGNKVGKPLRDPDRWLEVPPKKKGWVNSEFLAVPASEYVALDFLPVTHLYSWYLDDAGGLDANAVRTTLNAIAQDPRGPLRAGIDLCEASQAGAAHALVRFVPGPCGGAAGCYYKKAGQQARVDIDPKYFNTAWLSRVFLHETLGHAATRCYDHYQNAPQYPRSDYYGLMGNWQDQFGDHAWPDEDDIQNLVEWKLGQSPLVFVR